jgi:hypothetical protein
MARLTKSNAYAEQGAWAFVPPSDERIKAEKWDSGRNIVRPLATLSQGAEPDNAARC